MLQSRGPFHFILQLFSILFIAEVVSIKIFESFFVVPFSKGSLCKVEQSDRLGCIGSLRTRHSRHSTGTHRPKGTWSACDSWTTSSHGAHWPYDTRGASNARASPHRTHRTGSACDSWTTGTHGTHWTQHSRRTCDTRRTRNTRRAGYTWHSWHSGHGSADAGSPRRSRHRSGNARSPRRSWHGSSDSGSP